MLQMEFSVNVPCNRNTTEKINQLVQTKIDGVRVRQLRKHNCEGQENVSLVNTTCVCVCLLAHSNSMDIQE